MRSITVSCLALALASPPVAANPLQPQAHLETSRAKGRETGLPVPRFVSLKSREARTRVGPSLDYGTQWVYQVAGLPVEITAEYGNWRQIRDCDGVSGWMHRALLSSNRTALVGPWIASRRQQDGIASASRSQAMCMKMATISPAFMIMNSRISDHRR
jgi:SH3-like domain-containing protein